MLTKTEEKRLRLYHIYQRKDARTLILRLVYGSCSTDPRHMQRQNAAHPSQGERVFIPYADNREFKLAVDKVQDNLKHTGWPDWWQTEILNTLNRLNPSNIKSGDRS